MKKTVLTTLLLVILSIAAQSHEFWLQPRAFFYQPGEKMIVDFMVGENFTGEFWDLKRHTVEKFELIGAGSSSNAIGQVMKSNGSNYSVKLDKEGTWLLGMESNFAFIELDGKKFNEYLEEDGADNILSKRTKAGELGKSAKEHYKRFAKLMVQVGTKPDATYSHRLGYRHEIVPLSNPYALKPGDKLQCLVLWEGKPVSHLMVKVWNKAGQNNFQQNIYTGDDGTITFPVTHAGPWMVSAMKMLPAEKPGADYESFWTSLVFGVK